MKCVVIMFKILFFSTLMNFIVVNAAEDLLPRSGTSSTSGITFATLENANEAISRGAGDERNPFVGNVCRIIYSTKDGFNGATITQIAPRIFLGCKHTISELHESFNHFQQTSNIHSFQLAVESGNLKLSQALEMIPYLHPDSTVDIALVRLSFNQGAIPQCDFLSITSSLKEKEVASGFVVSCSEVSLAGGNPLDVIGCKRVLSVHRFQKNPKNNQEFLSSIPGRVPAAKEDEMLDAVVQLCNYKNPENRRKLKEVTGTAILEFPNSDKERLMCAMGAGTSGSPLVVKQGGAFKLIGMLQKGAAFPKAIIERALREDIRRDVVYTNNFIDLTAHRDWIVEGICTLSKIK